MCIRDSQRAGTEAKHLRKGGRKQCGREIIYFPLTAEERKQSSVSVTRGRGGSQARLLGAPTIKSVSYTHLVGQTGINGVGQLLAGAVTPSGSLADTFCYDNLTSPAIRNFYAQAYPNAAEFGIEDGHSDIKARYGVYQEGIYMGYRYYETRYEDVVMGTENAGDYDYTTTVAYPFGYGESYTTFAFDDYKVCLLYTSSRSTWLITSHGQ